MRFVRCHEVVSVLRPVLGAAFIRLPLADTSERRGELFLLSILLTATPKSQIPAIITIVIGAVLTFAAAAQAQDPQTPTASQAAPQTPGFWRRDRLTGDWGGYRTRWKNRGVELDVDLI